MRVDFGTAAGPWDEAAFADLLVRVREGAVERERERALPRDLIRELLAAGFGSARVPAASGGEGADLERLMDRVIRLAAADSNVSHVFRGHLAFVEQQFFEEDLDRREAWFGEVLNGALVGNAQSEIAPTSDLGTVLAGPDDAPVLNGRKYYTTGSIYADWIDLAAVRDGVDLQVIVSTHGPGVVSVDDWKGFGQRLTGSGTTVFTDAPVDPRNVRPYAADSPARHAYLMGFYQLVLLAVVAGIGRAAVDDAVAFVRPRRRIFGYAGEAAPRDDDSVQGVVGGLSSAAFAARAAVLQCARDLDAALRGLLEGRPDQDGFTEAQLNVYRAQQTVLPAVVGLTGDLFEVGGASSVDAGIALDRHWRNARTVATHNPAVHRRRSIGAWELNGTPPEWNRRAAPR